MAKKLAKVLGLVLVLVGLLGFVNNSIVGGNGFFISNTLHNIVHILLGVVLFVGAKRGFVIIKIVAAIFLLIAILGFVMGTNQKLLGLVTINTSDNWLHLVLSVVLFGVSMTEDSSKGSMPTN
jgi:Domain of unknown function (DUF4383)